ncbi:MAG: DUF2946 family protein [Hyphomicrobiaceae bacterium]
MHRWQRIARALALIGVMIHAGLLTWHNAAMLGSVLERNALAIALSEICHNGDALSSADRNNPADPGIPSENPGGPTGCPICKGAVAAVTLLPALDLRIDKPEVVTVLRIQVIRAVFLLPPPVQRLRPPTRAPPAFA